MKKFSKFRTIGRIRKIGKSTVCFILTLSLLPSFPIALSAEKTEAGDAQTMSTDASSVETNDVEYVKMPSEWSSVYYAYGVLPAHLAENTNLYRANNQAIFCTYTTTGDPAIWYTNSWTYSLLYKTFSGRGAKIQTAYNEILICNVGNYTATIVPGGGSVYSYFNYYMSNHQKQLKSRLVYLNEVENWVQYADVADYAGEYDKNFKTETIMTNWGTTSFSGNTFYTVRDIMFITADFVPPSNDYKISSEMQNGETVIWLGCQEDILRPSAPNTITYDDLATMQYKVTLVPKLAQSAAPTVLDFTATQYDGNKGIGLTTDTPEVLEGQEWRIVSIQDVSKRGEYPLYTTKGNTGTTVQSPMTDLAGNPLVFDTISLTRTPIYIDAKDPTVTEIILNSNMIKTDGELSNEDLFLSEGDWIQLSLVLSEPVTKAGGNDYGLFNVRLKLNLKDRPAENYGYSDVYTYLEEIKTIKPSAASGNVTMLVFKKIKLTNNAEGTLEVLEFDGADLFSDGSHNVLSGDVSNLKIDKQIAFDHIAPKLKQVEDVVTKIDKKDEKYLILKFNVDDGNGVGVNASDIQQFSVSSVANVQDLTWQFKVTQTADPVTFGSEGYSVSTETQFADYTIPATGDYFLHLYLKGTDLTELYDSNDSGGLKLDFSTVDSKNNKASANIKLTKLGIDAKAPDLTVTPYAAKTEQIDDVNRAVFSAHISAKDLNGVNRVEYQWVESDATPTDNGWTIASNTSDFDCSYTVTGNGAVSARLYVRAYDVFGNETEYISEDGTFVANLQRMTPRYEIISDDYLPGGISDIRILAPQSSAGTTGGYVRVMLNMDGTSYVRTFEAASDEDAISLFDSAAEWHAYTVSNSQYKTVGEAEALDWGSFYGTVSFTIAASLSDLTPVAGEALNKGTDISLLETGTISALYTCKRADVHSVSLTGVLDSAGNPLESYSKNGNTLYKVYNSSTGVRYKFTISNALMASLGVTDVDFDNSYAQFIVLDANGNATDTAMSAKIPLAVGATQTIAITENEFSDVSGAYGLVVTVAQKSGGVQEFTINEKLIVDNEALLVDQIGVVEYERSIEWIDGKLIDIGGKAADGEYLPSVDIGVAAPTDPNKPENFVYVDGKPAFVYDITNGMGTVTPTLIPGVKVSIKAQTTGATYLGETLGKVSGMRIWNLASQGNPSDLKWINRSNSKYGDTIFCSEINNNYAQYDLTFKPDWYYEGENPTPMIVSAEELAATDISEFKLALGRNVICYQFILENGKLSPEYRFEINLYDEAPVVDMTLEFGNSFDRTDYVRDDYHHVYPVLGTEYKRTVAQSVAFKIVDAYSPNGELTVYHAYVDPETGEWTYEIVEDASQPIKMITDSTNGYMGQNGTNPQYTQYDEPVKELIIVADEVGNANIFYPIVSDEYSQNITENGVKNTRYYYFEKNTDIGKLSADYGSSDGLEQAIQLGDTDILANILAKNFEEISIQIDDLSEVMLDTQGVNGEVYGNANDAGLLGMKYGQLYYVFKYDPSVAEGAEIKHTVTVRGYINGEIATDIDGNKAEYTLEVRAENVKPAVMVEEDSQIGAVRVISNTPLSLVGITNHETEGTIEMFDQNLGNSIFYGSYTDYFNTEMSFPIFENGTYTYGFVDKYGQYYEFPLEVTDLPSDPVVTFSETKVTKDPVTVTVTSTSGGSFTVDTSELPEGTNVTGNGTASLTIVLSDNASFDVSCEYSGSSYDIPINVTNIFNKPIVPKVVWGYNPYLVDTATNSYEGSVTVSLIDENGSILTDENGVAPFYTFVPGGETSYTFTNYTNHVGMKGADVTVTLPINLTMPVTENSANDTYAPEVGVTGYAKYQAGTLLIEGGYVSTDAARPAEEQIMLSNYVAMYGADNVYSDMSEMLSQLGWAQKFIFTLDIIDENATKLFISSDLTASAPDYDTGTSDGIEGVSIIGQTLQISKNCTFVLHVVDSKNNSTSIYFEIDMHEPPAPGLTTALIKNGDEARIYLTLPSLEGVANLKITNTDITPKVEFDKLSPFKGMQYLPVTTNGTVVVHYSYDYQGQTVEGQLETTVSGIDKTLPQVISTKWSANYDGTGTKFTNQDISVQMEFTKSLSDVYACDEEGNSIENPDGVTIVFMQDRVTVLYEKNAPELYIMVESSLNNSLKNIVSLPEIMTIDKVDPTLEKNVTMSENHSQATVTVTASETVTWQNGSKSEQLVEKLSQNGTYTYRVTDKAGNVGEIEVEISDLITEKLEMKLASDPEGKVIINPETYQVNIGDTLYVTVNRKASVTMNGAADGVEVDAGEWKPITIAEDSEGLYPSILAVDDYGNSVIEQLLRIPMKDRTAPSIMIKKSLLSASLDITAEELEAMLLENVIASDNKTAIEDLKFSFDIPNAVSGGEYSVTYYVEDEAGNKKSAEGWIRFHGGDEITIKVNGKSIEKDETVTVDSGEVVITLSHNGEPYKLDMREGNKSLGQMKNNAISLTDGYIDSKENEITLELTEAYYTFLVTTQGRDMYRFVIYVAG